MNLREGGPEDRAAIQRVSRASFDRVYAFFATRGSRKAWPLLLAEEEGRAVGFLEGRVFDGEPPIGYIYFVAVDPAFRRRHAGRLLVEESLRRFAARGVKHAFAAVPFDNEASMNLFTSLGFQPTPSRVMWRWYGWRGFVVEMRMVVAPHEVLLAHTFIDPSPASPQ